MQVNHCRIVVAALVALTFGWSPDVSQAQRLFPTLFPEQRSLSIRSPAELPRYHLPATSIPSTVSAPQSEVINSQISLDEAIRTSLKNSEVVRILTGISATNGGTTIYDVAASNTSIDDQQARFDPTLSLNETFNRLENPQAIFDPIIPGQSRIVGTRNDSFSSQINLSKINAIGGTWGLGIDTNPSRLTPNTAPLNPQTRSNLSLSYTQPILQGGRIGPNLAPIILARIDTERSYFQFKDVMQEHVRGVIEAYWSLVAARTDLWARRQQVSQLSQAVRQIEARVRQRLDNRGDLAQAKLALSTARANLINSEANTIQREAALRNILGLPPSDTTRMVPNTTPHRDRFIWDWNTITELAADQRPDLIELKLILEADQQQLLLAKNNALPRLDAVSFYRWNGLEGVMPNGNEIRSGSGSFTDWTLGINFSVPIGLRQGRAALRRQELIIARDRANLHQGLHNASHVLATQIRAIDQSFEQYLALKEARDAARVNLDAQMLRYRTQQTILLNVLQAISDWGNTVSAEAAALTQYNTLLANLERQTGTILETHGVVLFEERLGSVGPLGHFCPEVCYPHALRPSENSDRYPISNQPSEENFDLTAPPDLGERLPGVPYDDIKLPEFEDSLPDVPPRKPSEQPVPSNSSGSEAGKSQLRPDELTIPGGTSDDENE